MSEPLSYIGGCWVQPEERLAHWVCDANDGARLHAGVAVSAAQLEQALEKAAEAPLPSPAWATPARRVRLLRDAAEQLEGCTRELAWSDARTTGVVLGTAKILAGIAPASFRAAAEQLEREKVENSLPGSFGPVAVRRLPLGVAAVIAPWNAPAAIACHKVASALAAGCAVILKPSERAPESCTLIARALEAAGLAPEVFQLVQGGPQLGAALVGDRRVAAVSFTGGLAAGRMVAELCAQDMKAAQLELGGSNPLVVLEDADIEAASEGVVTALVTLNGQWCRALGRLLVHRKHQQELLERVLARLAEVSIGSSLEEDSEMGPLAYEEHRTRVAAAVEQLLAAGGEAHHTTSLPPLPGWFYPPTLITGVDAAQAREEIFGPVATVHSFATEDEALQLANATPYGLAAYVYGSQERAHRLGCGIRAGVVKLNGVGLTGLHPAAPRPVWGLSGRGEEGTAATLEFFRGTQVIGTAGPESVAG